MPARAAPRPPVLDVDPALPTLGRSRARLDSVAYYLLCQPGRLTIKPDGGSRSSGTAVATVVAALIIGVLVTIWVLNETDPGSAGRWKGALIFGILAGAVVAIPLFKLVEYFDKGRERRRPEAFARVTPRNVQAWQMCETAYDLAACRSWVDRTVDPRRRVPQLLWTAVRRSLELEEQQDAVSRARSHPSLDDLVREAAAKIAREHAALSTVTQNLRAIRHAARQVDRIRDARAQQERADREEQQEEMHLRSVLLETSTSASPGSSESRADAAAGLAAEAETVAALLADTDRILHTVAVRDLGVFPLDGEHVPAGLRGLLAADHTPHDPSTAPLAGGNLPMASNCRLTPAEQDERLQTITRLLIEALPPDWRKAAIVLRSVGRHVEYAASIRVGDGPMELWEPPGEVWTPFVDLRWGMYLQDEGTWNSARFDLDHPDRYSIRYDRGEPRWVTPPPREEVENEQKFFPRTEENTPDWLR